MQSVGSACALLLTLVMFGNAALFVSPQSWSIFVLEGDRAINDINTAAATAPVIEVRDANGRPVRGIEVVFRAPVKGPGGTFGESDLQATGTTNEQGQATVAWKPNKVKGYFVIQVEAKSPTGIVTGEVRQQNAAGKFASGPGEKKHDHKWVTLSLVVGGVAAAASGIALGVGGSSAGGVVVKPGPISIGGGR